MAQLSLLPSSYQLSNTSYLTISNANNMYTNIDSTTYATINHKRNQTTAYYVYIRGFDFSQVPSNATINSAVVKVKAYVQNASSSTPGLYNGTTSLNASFGSAISTSIITTTVDITDNWNTYQSYGSNFGIGLQLNRSKRNTASYLYIYGTEITVDYTVNVERSVVISGVNCTVDPSGTVKLNDGDVLTLNIDAPNQNVTITDNGIDVTSQLHEAPISREVSSVPISYTTSGSISGTNYQNAVGKDHTTNDTSNNDYCSTNGSTAYIEYLFDVSSIPDDANIQSVICKAKGHCESTSSSSEVARLQLYNGSIAKGSTTDFTSTTDEVKDVGGDSSWTRSELDDIRLRFTIGYYGGLVSGASLIVTYSVEINGYAYYYEIVISSDHTIVVNCIESTEHMYIKVDNSWQTVSIVYKKINGVWVEQTNLTTLFDVNKNYVKG